MAFSDALKISAGGMEAERVRMNVLSGNLANADSLHGNENGVAIRLSRNFMNDNLRTSLAALYYFEGADYAIRPKLIYAFNGHWVGSVFADDYQGPAHSYFGYLKKNSLVMAEITYEF